MNQDEYRMTQERLQLLGGFVHDLDLDGFIESINTCETVAPILDPTLYMQGAAKLEDVKRLAIAARDFQVEVNRQIEKAHLNVREAAAAIDRTTARLGPSEMPTDPPEVAG